MEIKYRRDLNQLLPKHPVVAEIGVAEGRFSHDILRDWRPSTLYLVDAWKTLPLPGDAGFEQAWHDKNLAETKTRVFVATCETWVPVFLQGGSVEMATLVDDLSLDLAYLDASHDYESVKADCEAWWPKVKSGGIMATHDYLTTEAGPAFDTFARRMACEVHLIPEDKPEDAGAWIRKG